MRHHPGLAASPRVRCILILGRVAFFRLSASEVRAVRCGQTRAAGGPKDLLSAYDAVAQREFFHSSAGATVPTNRVGPKSRVRNCMGLGSADPHALSTTMRCRVSRMKARGERNTTPDPSARTDVSRLAPNELTFENDLEGRTRRTAVVLWSNQTIQAIYLGMGESFSLHRHYATQISISLGAPLKVRRYASGRFSEQRSRRS